MFARLVAVKVKVVTHKHTLIRRVCQRARTVSERLERDPTHVVHTLNGSHLTQQPQLAASSASFQILRHIFTRLACFTKTRYKGGKVPGTCKQKRKKPAVEQSNFSRMERQIDPVACSRHLLAASTSNCSCHFKLCAWIVVVLTRLCTSSSNHEHRTSVLVMLFTQPQGELR